MRNKSGVAMLAALLLCAAGAAADYRFVIIPKVVHPWFDKVNQGAVAAAELLTKETGKTFSVDYRAPQTADVVLQNEILERAIATRPTGIAIDLLDPDGNRAVLEEALAQGIAVVVFGSEPPEGMPLTKIGSDFIEQATIAAERLAQLLDYEGEVAIMHGVPTAPSHRIRAETHRAIFAKYPKMTVVAEGVDNDDIQTAQKEAASIISAYPNLRGMVACDAAGPVGIGIAIKEAEKVGKVLMVGMDDLNQLIELIGEGVAESSSATKPLMQGHWSVLSMWQQSMGVAMPTVINTGVAVITKDMTKDYKGF